MFSKLLGRIALSSLRSQIIAGLIAFVLAAGFYGFHQYKQGLREEGRQECIQTVNEETLQILQEQLAAERAVVVEMVRLGVVRNAANAEATARHQATETKVSELKRQIAEQERTDETYNAWANTPLPNGVRNRLQLLRSGDN